MFQKFMAKISTWVGLSAEDCIRFLSWLDLNSSSHPIENPNVLVARATDREGKTVVYLTAEPVFILSNYAPSPHITQSDAQHVGDIINSVIEREARKIGAGRFLIVLPDGVPPERDEKLLRVIEQTIPKKPTTFGLQHNYSDFSNRNQINQPTSLTAKEWKN
jgi:hypothetical protein